MRKADEAVMEVVCSETGKPMPKIPLWMAGIHVRFVSDEARQKHPTPMGLLDSEPERRSLSAGADLDELKDLGTAGGPMEEEEEETEFEDMNEEGGEEY